MSSRSGQTGTETIQDPFVGSTLGTYRIERRLGQGGFGAVYEATDLREDVRVALKVLLNPRGQGDPLARFRREAVAMSRLECDHTIRVKDTGEADGKCYIAMELLHGRDLSTYRKESIGLSLVTAVEYVLQACDSVGEAHAKGIIHRDLKPENLFEVHGDNDSRMIKVLDFGLARVEGEVKLTTLGMVMCTPYYCAPEQHQSMLETDPRADIWALGAILYELCTRHRPYSGRGAELFFQKRDPPIDSFRALCPDAPPSLEEAIMTCLQPDQVKRYQHVEDLARALRQARQDLGDHRPSREPSDSEHDRLAHLPPSAPETPHAITMTLSQVDGVLSDEPARAETASEGDCRHPFLPTETPRSGDNSRVSAIRSMSLRVYMGKRSLYSSLAGIVIMAVLTFLTLKHIKPKTDLSRVTTTVATIELMRPPTTLSATASDAPQEPPQPVVSSAPTPPMAPTTAPKPTESVRQPAPKPTVQTKRLRQEPFSIKEESPPKQNPNRLFGD